MTIRPRPHAVAARVSLVVAALALATLAPRAAEPEQAAGLARLRAGNDRFVKSATAPMPAGAATRQSLVKEQHPFAMVLSCADSRVPPEYIFNTGLGELFVVRAAGEVVDKSVMASLEYGAEHLHIPLLVVMGHESCGAVKAAVESEHGEGPNLDYLVSHIRAGVHFNAAEKLELRTAILENVEEAINDAMAGSQILRTAATSGHLQIVGAYYELGSGHVEFSEPVGLATHADHK
ncbi:MAG: carbonic anhydrase [Vicinamibacterales bacterium]